MNSKTDYIVVKNYLQEFLLRFTMSSCALEAANDNENRYFHAFSLKCSASVTASSSQLAYIQVGIFHHIQSCALPPKGIQGRLDVLGSIEHAELQLPVADGYGRCGDDDDDDVDDKRRQNSPH